MEKIIRALLVGFIVSVATMISLGWKAYGEINDMGKIIKAEVKKEMMEVRGNDMEWIQSRFNSLEMLYAGKVISHQKQFSEDQK